MATAVSMVQGYAGGAGNCGGAETTLIACLATFFVLLTLGIEFSSYKKSPYDDGSVLPRAPQFPAPPA